jgi:serine/threonine protein kinase
MASTPRPLAPPRSLVVRPPAAARRPSPRSPRGERRARVDPRRAAVADPDAESASSSRASNDEPFSLNLRRDAEDALALGEPLGRGAMGVVRVATRKSDGAKFALKTIPKAGPVSLAGQTPSGDAMTIWERKVRDEVNLHFALGASLDIVTLHDAFEDEAGVHLLVDLCDGGDLLVGASRAHTTEDEANAPNQFITVDDDDDDDDSGSFSASSSSSSSSSGQLDPECGAERGANAECWQPFSEATAAPMIRSMLRALAACHEHGVVHRDVKPANFLFLREADGSQRLKLSDFGLAARIKSKDATLTEVCGSYAYLSPEMARRRPYDFKVDSWAAGVVVYMLLAGEPPFSDWDAIREGREPTKEGLLRNIRRGRPEHAIQDLPLSPGAKSLLSSLLELNPEKRMSCAAAAEHYWVREKGVAKHADALASVVVERLQAYGTLGAVRRASIRAAYEAVGGDFVNTSAPGGEDQTARLVEAVDRAAAAACAEHLDVECDAPTTRDGSYAGVSAEALRVALRDHGAELAPQEWMSLIRPVAGKGRRGDFGGKGDFVDNAALAAMLAVPGGSFSSHFDDEASTEAFELAATASSRAKAEGEGEGDDAEADAYDWDAIAKASFQRLLEKNKSKPGADVFDALDETVTFDDVADEVCAWDGSEELCRATLKEEFEAVDVGKTGKLGISQWTDLVWSEGLTDASGRVRSSCGADAPAADSRGPTIAGVGATEDCELRPESTAPPTELSPREKAKAAAAARREMSAKRAAARAAKRGPSS